ncbi:TIGR01777 family oxidoreductase [Mucilaginibacter sp. McL0603]|uniref:TIGR01777 family oxidoreductase n=1 Tax=Mucilaginibacter sp. McL0603 TaxID=3415670 RepID=UPI003CF6C11B
MNQRQSNSKHILITGGTGLIGKLMTDKLIDLGYQVSYLSRKPGNNPNVKTYLWDIVKGRIDENCIDDIDAVLHLAGAGIADKRWTDKRKKEIIESRTKSIGMIYRLIKNKPNKINTIISASAIGYYSNRGDELLTEQSLPGRDFMAQCCMEWEDAVDKGRALGLRILKFRTGVVLYKDEGALPQMAMPVKLGFGAPFGNGKQWIPWIHWQDVVDMYLYGIENINLTGVYNMVAPEPVTNKQLIKALAKQLHRPAWPVKVPAFVFKLLMGEMSTLVLGSTKVSAQKIEKDGFVFKYPDLPMALKEIYG